MRFVSICEKVIKSDKSNKNSLFKDSLIQAFNNIVLNANEQIKRFNLRKYVQYAFYEIMNLVNDYLNLTSDYSNLKDLMLDWIKILTPLMPHICEELWERSGMKGFISLESWPDVKKSKTDKSVIISLISNVISDINQVIKLVGKKPEKIKIFVCEEWKHDLFNIIRDSEDKRDIKSLIKQSMKLDSIKKNGKQATRIIQSITKDPSKLIKSTKEEYKALSESKDFIREKFNAEIEVINAKDSKEIKAKNALPGKPGIIIE
jgi:leucyl-tRNA synthetase